MATLIKNSGTGGTPECSETLKLDIDNRTEEAHTDIAGPGGIRDQILDLDATISASTDPKIKQIKRATSFPIQDVYRMLAENPDAKYLRVYNGFKDGEFVTYMAPVSDTFQTYVAADSSDDSVISKACCACRPCTIDRILNPIP
jgi:hypothetical protein